MSGFIGMDVLFAGLESALDIKLKQDDRKNIGHAIYPLSKKNYVAITDQDIQEALRELEHVGDLDIDKVREFLFNYLNENIKDMLKPAPYLY